MNRFKESKEFCSLSKPVIGSSSEEDVFTVIKTN